MKIGMETAAAPGPGQSWLDVNGFAGPIKPGNGPRRDPNDEFPTGPDIGAPLPSIRALSHDGTIVDVHEHRAGKPAAVVFFRSAVW